MGSLHRRSHGALLVVLLLVAAAVPLAMSAAADAELWSARLIDFRASYGQEAWKYDTAYEGQASTATILGHVQNQTTSYYGAVGLRATLTIEIFDTQEPGRAAGTNYNVTAYLPTGRGDNHALVKREGTSNTFQLDFDLDGANNVDPRGQATPPADPGLQNVQVAIQRRYVDTQTTGKVGEAVLQFSYDQPFAQPRVPAYAGLSHWQGVPDSIFRLFNDVGWDRSILMITRPVRTAPGEDTVQVDYEFSPLAAGQTVELYALLAERGVNAGANSQPAPAPTLPFIPGLSDNETAQNVLDNTERLVVVSSLRLATATVSDTGAVSFDVTATQLLSARNPPPPTNTGLVVLAPLLVSNFDRATCPGDCLGGPQYRTGATELVVPVTSHRAVVDSYRLVDPGLTGQGAPEPIRDVALGVNALQVLVRDPEGFNPPQDTRSGDVFAIVPEVRSSAPLGKTGLSPNQREFEPGERQTLLGGNLPVRGIQNQHVSQYRVLAFLYQASDAFYGVTWGDRGYILTLSAPPSPVPDGGVTIQFESRTTNYDLLPNEPAFGLKILYEIRVPDLNLNQSDSITLREAATDSIFLPLTVPTAADVAVAVETTSGDVLPRAQDITAVFFEPEPPKKLADRIPGFEAPLAALAALGAALAFLRRRP